MIRWKLTFEYDGTEFFGWQIQPEMRTVEGEAEKAFSKLYQQPVDLIGQGRTDAGVHARGQVAHADLPDRFSARRLVYAMRGMLPKDVALLKAEEVEDTFHARFSAENRSYSYKVVENLSPLLRNRAWCCGAPLNLQRLNHAAELALEATDFVNFCIPDPAPESTTIVRLSESQWVKNENTFVYQVTGNRFLRHMVRRLVGEMIHVAIGRQTSEEYQQMLQSKKVKRKGHAAPAHGLYLEQVMYPVTHQQDNTGKG